MATYSSPQYTNLTPTPGMAGFAQKTIALRFPITVTAALTTADVLNFGYAPAGFRVISATLIGTDMDTNGSPALAFNIGDSGDVDRLFAASTVGQAASMALSTLVTAIDYQYTTKTLITGAPSTNAATGVAGTLTLIVVGVIEGQAS